MKKKSIYRELKEQEESLKEFLKNKREQFNAMSKEEQDKIIQTMKVIELDGGYLMQILQEIEAQEIDCEIQAALPRRIFDYEGNFVEPGKA